MFETGKFFESLLDRLAPIRRRTWPRQWRPSCSPHCARLESLPWPMEIVPRRSRHARQFPPLRKNAFVDFGETEGNNSRCEPLPQPQTNGSSRLRIATSLSSGFRRSFPWRGNSRRSWITVEVVFGQIEQHRDPRTELFNPLQLEAADLDHAPIPVSRPPRRSTARRGCRR